MNNQFVFLDYEEQSIQGKKFLCVYIIEIKHHTVHRIFKQYKEDLKERLIDLDIFEDITTKIDFVIKRDGKIALDINI